MKIAIGLAALVLTLGTPAFAAESACEGGRYRLEGNVPFAPFDSQLTVIAVVGKRVSMDPCGEADRARVRRRGGRMRVRASWRQCGEDGGRVRLRLRTNRGCEQARGRLRSKRPRGRVRFVANRGCELAILCLPGSLPVDTDGDRCEDSCVPCPQFLCRPGFRNVDTDGNGCSDSCEPVANACFDDADCFDRGLYCGREPEDCNGTGSCRPRAEFCTRQYDPICGCDGRTYGNDCDAAASGVNVAYAGVCEPCATVDCGEGDVPVDRDGDGCTEACEPQPIQ